MNRYEYIKMIQQKESRINYYSNNIYPDIPITNQDSYIITTAEDRLDLLALDFYNDDRLWWVIASANSLPGDSMYPPVGIQLRIPSDIRSVLNEYRKTNLSI